jgi:hypothetical protein
MKSSARAVARRVEAGSPLPWLILATTLATGVAQAQQTPPSPVRPGVPTSPTDPTVPPEGGTRPGVDPGAPPDLSPGTGPGGDPAGKKTGVIRPPAGVDPGIQQTPTPSDAFPTPIIPPPGSPGGNNRVVPK